MVGFVADEGLARYEKYHANLSHKRKNEQRRIYESIENNRLEMIEDEVFREFSRTMESYDR